MAQVEKDFPWEISNLCRNLTHKNHMVSQSSAFVCKYGARLKPFGFSALFQNFSKKKLINNFHETKTIHSERGKEEKVFFFCRVMKIVYRCVCVFKEERQM